MSRSLRMLTALALGAAALSAAARASAQEPQGFGEQQPLVISLEHIGGFSWSKYEAEGGDDDITSTQAGTFTPFFGPLGTNMRLGINYFVAPPLSVGGLFNYSDNDQFGTYLLVGARIGAAFPISSGTAIWLRGGIAYQQTEFDFISELKWSAWVPGGEVYLVLQPVDNFGILLGGLFERTVGGKIKQESSLTGTESEADFTRTEVALSFGVLAEF